MSKPALGYLLFDLPGDHEIESSLATQCMVIESLIHNLGRKARVKRVCVASTARFKTYPTYKYGVQFVHLACHGGKHGIEMLGGNISWKEVADQVKRHLHPLKAGEQRVMVFSCCHSKAGFNATRAAFKDYFTGAYYFSLEELPFAYAITVWSMFYLKKTLSNPHAAIVADINSFLGEPLLVFGAYP